MVVPVKTGDESSLLRGKRAPLAPLLLQVVELFLVGVAASSEKEEHGFWQRFMTTCCLLGIDTELRDRVTPESDACVGVEGRPIPKHCWQSSHSHDGIVHFDFLDGLIAVGFAEVYEL